LVARLGAGIRIGLAFLQLRAVAQLHRSPNDKGIGREAGADCLARSCEAADARQLDRLASGHTLNDCLGDLWFHCRRFASPLMPQVLPCPGSPGEQPAALMDAFAIIDSLEKPSGE
jgi:hypothetical protein